MPEKDYRKEYEKKTGKIYFEQEYDDPRVCPCSFHYMD